MNSHTKFEVGGIKAKCNICDLMNDVPLEYQGPVDEFGRRTDIDVNPNYYYGTFEYLLAKNWVGADKKLIVPTFVFCIDISPSAV